MPSSKKPKVEKSKNITIRPADDDDVTGLTHVHISSWQTSYRGMVPDEMLDTQSVERREGYWRQVIGGEGISQFVLVAQTEQGDIAGFVSGGKSRLETLPFDGELYAIYLLESYKRQGIGERLFRAALEKLKTDGYRSMMLWVLADNIPARRFYEKMGGKSVTEQMITIGGRELMEVAYGWETLMP